jgi:hypothetical protein
MNDHPYSDPRLADEIIARLNLLCHDPAIRADLGKLINMRIGCSKATQEHPTIQTSLPAPIPGLCECGPYGSTGWCPICNPGPEVGFLGLLNGLVGAIRGPGRLSGWGYVMAVFDDSGKLERFKRSDSA